MYATKLFRWKWVCAAAAAATTATGCSVFITKEFKKFNLPNEGTSPFLLKANCLGPNSSGNFLSFSGNNGDDEDDEFTNMAEKKFECVLQEHYYYQFCQFASYEYRGEFFMSPKDFIMSVSYFLQDSPVVTSRYRLNKAAYYKLLSHTPDIQRLSKNSFRDLGARGLLSFYDFVFLITILKKPQRGFHLAFKVFDRDSSNSIELKEYTKISKVMLDWSPVKSNASSKIPNSSSSEEESPEERLPATTITRLFFGKYGDEKLYLRDLSAFADHLQTEILDIEFFEFSKGTRCISPLDLGELLLRRCRIPSSRHAFYLHRLQTRMAMNEVQEITFEAFKEAVYLFKNLDDFRFAIHLFILSGRSVCQDEFQRAVRAVTGKYLEPQVLNVFFCLFDNDGDGQLNYEEFFRIFRPSPLPHIHLQKSPSRLALFKSCVMREMNMK